MPYCKKCDVEIFEDEYNNLNGMCPDCSRLYKIDKKLLNLNKKIIGYVLVFLCFTVLPLISIFLALELGADFTPVVQKLVFIFLLVYMGIFLVALAYKKLTT